MDLKEKELLLKDLCARLLYGVKIHYRYSNSLGRVFDEDRELDFSDVETLKYSIENKQDDWCDFSLKPYLRPMSSMTEEEKREYQAFFNYDGVEHPEEYIDWLLAHHFDFRGLIEKALAIEALTGMYV